MKINDLLTRFVKTEFGLKVLTFDFNKDKGYRINNSSDLYSGQAGFLILLVREYSIYQDAKLLDYIIALRKNLIQDLVTSHRDLSMSFLTGISGIIYAALCSDKYCTSLDTDEKEIINKVIKDAIARYHTTNLLAEYIGGHAGAIIGILKILSLNSNWLEEDSVNELLRTSLMALILTTKVSDDGIFWDHSLNNHFPLNGFSHGNAGIAYTLQILSKITQNYHGLYGTLLAGAFKYEDANVVDDFFPDYRIKEEHLKENPKLSTNYEITGRSFNVWCHGNLGALIPRKHKSYQGKFCLDNLYLDSDINSNCLCHGILGNFIISDFLLDKKGFRSVKESLNEKRQLGLFTGAGSYLYYSQYSTKKIPPELNVFIPFWTEEINFKSDRILATLNYYGNIDFNSFQLDFNRFTPFGINIGTFTRLNVSPLESLLQKQVLSEINKNKKSLNLDTMYYIAKSQLTTDVEIELLSDLNVVIIENTKLSDCIEKKHHFLISTCMSKIIFISITEKEYEQYYSKGIIPKNLTISDLI